MFMCCSLPSNFQKHQHQLSWARRPKGCPVILEREIFYQEDTTTTTTTTPEGTKLWLFFFPYLGRITPDSRKESRVKYECLDENVTGKVVCQVRKFWFQSRQVCWNMTSTPFMMCWNWMFQWPSNQLSTSQVDTPFGGVMGSWVVVFRVFLLSSRLPPWNISLAQKCWSLIFGGRAGATEDGDMELRLPQGVGEALLVGWKNGYPQKTDIAMEHSPFLIGVSSSNGCSSSVMLVFGGVNWLVWWLSKKMKTRAKNEKEWHLLMAFL